MEVWIKSRSILLLPVVVLLAVASGCTSTTGDRSLSPRWSLPSLADVGQDDQEEHTGFSLTSFQTRRSAPCATG